MTIVSQIITDAHRESNLIALGRTPSAAQQAEAFRRLQNIVDSVMGGEVGELLNNWPLGNYGRDTISRVNADTQVIQHPMINARLIAVNEDPIELQFPVNPSPGSRMAILDPFNRLSQVPVTISGNGRPIEGQLSQTLNVDGTNRSWLYREDLGGWVRLTDLDIDGEFTFPSEFDDYFVISLGMRINPRFGATLDAQSLARLKEVKRDLQNNYLQSAPLQINPEISFPTMQSYNNWADAWFGGGSTGAWARGGWWSGGPL